MQMKERYRIMHTLQCVKGSPEVEDALERVETILSHLPEVLEHLAVSKFDFKTGLKIAEAAGLKHHYATAFLYGRYLLVEELYDEDDDFAAAINVLIDGFEYPDWSHKTVGEVLEKFK
jgi:hypothetical protein